MAQALIQQHYYTRGREGLFQGGEGFDTVAKSAGLEASFIKKTLHPYCLYIAPQELIRRGELDPARYPESLTVFPAETGELVIGRAVFSGSDFTGQREAVFIHQFVIPRTRADEFLKDPAALLKVTAFRGKYDESEGKDLPELDRLPHAEAAQADERDAVLARLGVGETVFKSLLAAIFAAVSSKRKVYVALDADVSESSRLAASLMEILYGCLPLEVRRRFGFTTYNNEPQGKKGIDLMFVEKGSIRPGDRSTGKDLLFDFPNGKFPVPEPGTKTAFLDLAWEKRNAPGELAEFYDFASEALDGFPASEQTALVPYQELAAVYRTGRGEYERYPLEKGEISAAILRYLKAGGHDRKPRLSELLLALLRQERSQAAANGTSAPPMPASALAAYMDFYEEAPANDREEIAGAVIEFLDKLAAVTQEEPESGTPASGGLTDAGGVLRKHPELQRIVYERTGRDIRYSGLQEALLSDRMSRVKTVKEIQEEIVFWVSHSLDSLALPYFIDRFGSKLRKALLKSGDQAVAGESLFRFCSQLYKAHPNKKGFEAFCDALEMETARVVLDSLSLTTSTYAEVMQAGYILAEDRLLTGVGLTEEQAGKLRILRGVYEAMVNQGPVAALGAGKKPAFGEGDPYGAKVLPPADQARGREQAATPLKDKTGGEYRFPAQEYSNGEMNKIQELVRRFLKGRIHPPQYGTLLFAFTDWGLRTGGEDRPVSYFDLLAFLEKETEGTDEVDDFLVWSSAQTAFRDAGGRMLRPAYRNALRKYFTEVDRKGLGDRKRFRQLTDESLPKEFRKVISDIREEGGNPVVRLLNRNRRTLSLSLLVLVLGMAAVFLYGRPGAGKGEAPSPSPSPVLSPSPGGSAVPQSPAASGNTAGSAVSPSPASPAGSSSPDASISPSPQAP